MNPVRMARFVVTGDPAAYARETGRSWWVLRCMDGRIVPEWMCDWPTQAPTKGRQALRLYCPDGRVAEVGSTADATGRLFQFKVAVRSAGPGGMRQQLLAHVIGIIEGTDGQCRLYAWRPETRCLEGPIFDNAYALAYEQIGPLCADHLGLARA